MATINAMLENSATFGTRKPVKLAISPTSSAPMSACRRAAQAADDDDDEDQHVDLRAHLGHHVLVTGPTSRRPGPARAEPTTNTPTNRRRMR